MSYVRYLISEEKLENGGAIRRYEVELPPEDELYDYGRDRRNYPKLLEMELRLSPKAVIYFKDTPYTLANTIWTQGVHPDCDVAFCCCELPVLYSSLEPVIKCLTNIKNFDEGCPHIVLEVRTEREWV